MLHVTLVWTPRCKLLGVVAQSLKPDKRAQQLPPLLGQQCWELLRPFARNLRAVKMVRATQNAGLTNGKAAKCAPEVAFSHFRALSHR